MLQRLKHSTVLGLLLALVGAFPAMAQDSSVTFPLSLNTSSFGIVSGVRLNLSHGTQTDRLFETITISYYLIGQTVSLASDADDPEYSAFVQALTNSLDDGMAIKYQLVGGSSPITEGTEADYFSAVIGGNGVDLAGHTLVGIDMHIESYNDSVFAMPPIFFTSVSLSGTITVRSTHPEPCVLQLSPGRVDASSGGGDYLAELLVSSYSPYCYWPLGPIPAWLTVTPPPLSKKGGQVTIQVQANPGGPPRSAVVTLGGQSLQVSQASSARPALDLLLN